MANKVKEKRIEVYKLRQVVIRDLIDYYSLLILAYYSLLIADLFSKFLTHCKNKSTPEL